MQAAVMLQDRRTETETMDRVAHACARLILTLPSSAAALPLQPAAAGAARSTPQDVPLSDDAPEAADWSAPGSLPKVPAHSVSPLEHTLWHCDASPESLYLWVRLSPTRSAPSTVPTHDGDAPPELPDA